MQSRFASDSACKIRPLSVQHLQLVPLPQTHTQHFDQFIWVMLDSTIPTAAYPPCTRPISNISTYLQAIAVSATLFKSKFVRCVYSHLQSGPATILITLSPNSPSKKNLLLDNFDINSKKWHCSIHKNKDKMVGDLLTQRDLSMLNHDSTA